MLSCKEYSDIIEDESIWKNLLKTKFSYQHNDDHEESFKEIFRYKYISWTRNNKLFLKSFGNQYDVRLDYKMGYRYVIHEEFIVSIRKIHHTFLIPIKVPNIIFAFILKRYTHARNEVVRRFLPAISERNLDLHDMDWWNAQQYTLRIYSSLLLMILFDSALIYQVVNFYLTKILSFDIINTENIAQFFQFITLPIFVYINCILLTLPIVIFNPSLLLLKYSGTIFSFKINILSILNATIYLISLSSSWFISINYRPFRFIFKLHKFIFLPLFRLCRDFINQILILIEKFSLKIKIFYLLVFKNIQKLYSGIMFYIRFTGKGILNQIQTMHYYNDLVLSTGTNAFKSMGIIGEILLIPYSLLWMFWPISIPYFTKIPVLYILTIIMSLGLVIRGYRTINREWSR